jgi:hypothetical protein
MKTQHTTTTTLRILASTALCSFTLITCQARPANDMFAGRIILTGTNIIVTGSNVGATKEAGEPDHAGNAGGASVWWQWTAPFNCTVTITTAGSSFDTLLGVYTGSSVSALTTIAANDNAPNGFDDTSKVVFSASANQTYQIAVDGYHAHSGSVQLQLLIQAQPANDMFANRIILTGANIVATGSNVGATKEPGEPDHAGNAGGASVWWQWTAPSNCAVTITTAGSSFNTLLGVYTGSSVSALTTIAANDQAPNGSDDTSKVVFSASANQTYQIAVDGHGADSGSVQLQLLIQAPPANDSFADRIILTGTNIVATGSNVGATKEAGEPDHAGNAGGASVWWQWTAPSNCAVTITTAGSSFNTLLGVYTGSSVSALTEIVSSDDAPVVFNATANQSYDIAVDGYGADSGSVQLQLFIQAPPANDSFAGRIILTGTNIVATGSNVGATKEPGEPPNLAGDPGGASVWWQWTAPSSDTFTISTAGSSFDTLLGVYTGSSVSVLTEVASNDDDPDSDENTSKVVFSATANQTYQIAVDGYDGESGDVQLAIKSGAPELVAWGAYDSYIDPYHNHIVLDAYVPAGLSNVVAVATGELHSLALTADGNVVAWGNFLDIFFMGSRLVYPVFVPAGLSNVVAIAGGGCHSLALTAEGKVMAWGRGRPGTSLAQTNVPAGLSNVVAIAAGAAHSLALTAEGRVVAWGDNSSGQTNVPSGLSNVVAIAAGGILDDSSHSLALTAEGRIVAWGSNDYGQTDVPAGLSNVVAIAAGAYHSLALTAGGQMVAWGDNYFDQTNVPNWLNSVVAIAAGGYNNLALTADGRVAAWGENYFDQTNAPNWLNSVVAIAAGGGDASGHFLTLTRQPSTPAHGLELTRGLSGLELRGHGAPGISCQLLRASRLDGPWLPTQPVSFTNTVQLLRAPDTSAPVQFFRLLRK